MDNNICKNSNWKIIRTIRKTLLNVDRVDIIFDCLLTARKSPCRPINLKKCGATDRQHDPPEEMKRYDTLGRHFDRLSPELHLREDGTVKHVVFLRLGVERAHRRVVTHLLADDAKPQLFPAISVVMSKSCIE